MQSLAGEGSIDIQPVHDTGTLNHRTSHPRRERRLIHSACSLSLMPFSRRTDKPIFLLPNSCCLTHTPDGSACLRNIDPFSLFLTSSVLSVTVWKCLNGWNFHSTTTRFLGSLMSTFCLSRFLAIIRRPMMH